MVVTKTPSQFWALVCCLLSFGALSAQDSLYQKEVVLTSDINLLLSYYDQDGIHSAVTGGTGTEKLEVYAIDLSTRTVNSSGDALLLNIGVDIISSASTDNIDFEVSSESILDQRIHIVVGYEKALKKNQFVGADISYSIESDYTSRGIGLWYQKFNAANTRRLSFNFKAYFDDLRWGRLSEPYFVPEKLIYPEELRYQEWFDIHNRYSFNLSMGYEMDLNRKMNLSFYPSLAYQQGLLSTTFHRVYFATNNDLRVENLPRQRTQGAIGTQLNSFIGRRTILRSFYQYYMDEFGINSHTLKVELPYKLNANVSVAPFGRIYQQKAVRYFKPYAQHSVDQEYYTSDYDLSAFWSSQVGLDLSLTLTGKKTRKYAAKAVNFRYSYYNRSDGLQAHMIAVMFQFRATKFNDHLNRQQSELLN